MKSTIRVTYCKFNTENRAVYAHGKGEETRKDDKKRGEEGIYDDRGGGGGTIGLVYEGHVGPTFSTHSVEFFPGFSSDETYSRLGQFKHLRVVRRW